MLCFYFNNKWNFSCQYIGSHHSECSLNSQLYLISWSNSLSTQKAAETAAVTQNAADTKDAKNITIPGSHLHQ